ncbi:unnamed protein product [Cyprideis torosa]|uniref:Uncharacterized protein n=1 Tax=Cyprideis torosa TaxID=163714 RepID=A0A7R8ZLZ6_9CRUS|nr:unnamed protein product [Cyprideis torosa]CAG0894410.1 unnamed protein product [Cyprideis torosa]
MPDNPALAEEYSVDDYIRTADEGDFYKTVADFLHPSNSAVFWFIVVIAFLLVYTCSEMSSSTAIAAVDPMELPELSPELQQHLIIPPPQKRELEDVLETRKVADDKGRGTTARRRKTKTKTRRRKTTGDKPRAVDVVKKVDQEPGKGHLAKSGKHSEKHRSRKKRRIKIKRYKHAGPGQQRHTHRGGEGGEIIISESDTDSSYSSETLSDPVTLVAHTSMPFSRIFTPSVSEHSVRVLPYSLPPPPIAEVDEDDDEEKIYPDTMQVDIEHHPHPFSKETTRPIERTPSVQKSPRSTASSTRTDPSQTKTELFQMLTPRRSKFPATGSPRKEIPLIRTSPQLPMTSSLRKVELAPPSSPRYPTRTPRRAEPSQMSTRSRNTLALSPMLPQAGPSNLGVSLPPISPRKEDSTQRFPGSSDVPTATQDLAPTETQALLSDRRKRIRDLMGLIDEQDQRSASMKTGEAVTQRRTKPTSVPPWEAHPVPKKRLASFFMMKPLSTIQLQEIKVKVDVSDEDRRSPDEMV